jgi:hypothetical protein
MNLAAASLLLLVLGLVVFDWITQRGRNRRGVLLEAGAFVVGAFFIAFPDRATDLAHLVGIGRGVDFLLYPLVIWLVRESLLTRRLRQEEGERMTQLARALAIAQAQVIPARPYSTGSSERAPAQSAGSSASTTT